ncbi:hypothetical protein L207DRAFT_639506 [Hyaloscypha variabilis F]|uniref:Uncharacterized protein n=1 Tax=Hyaloscypha variabilis (strain UAMH 11265 / GT02V1 / F) TaxID=1149755 RepID=A0A2J6R4F0_HYAVF|nr:hypothetical protein L207DRAFT_639506 [Hyaloscypha variabilis F]
MEEEQGKNELPASEAKLPSNAGEPQIVQNPGESLRNQEIQIGEGNTLIRDIGVQASEGDFQAAQRGRDPNASEKRALGSERGSSADLPTGVTLIYPEIKVGPSQATETEGKTLETQGWRANCDFQAIEEIQRVRQWETELRARQDRVQAREQQLWDKEVEAREAKLNKVEKELHTRNQNLKKEELEASERESKLRAREEEVRRREEEFQKKTSRNFGKDASRVWQLQPETTNQPTSSRPLAASLPVHSSEKDITIRFELDVEIDIEGELDALIRFNRLGRFNDAIEIFERVLNAHLDLFPVVAEYADLLFQRGSFGQLSQFLEEQLAKEKLEKRNSSGKLFAEEQILLLKNLKALADIYTKGALMQALKAAKSAMKYLSQLLEDNAEEASEAGSDKGSGKTSRRGSETDSDSYTGTSSETDTEEDMGEDIYDNMSEGTPWYSGLSVLKIKIIEAILRIVAFARQYSSFLDTEKFRDLYDTKLGNWYRKLLQKGFYWEAYRFLSILLPMFTLAESSDLLQDQARFEEALPEYSEDFFLTGLAVSRLLGSFLLKYSNTGTLLMANLWFERAEILAKTILANEPDHIQSRPVLVWMMQKESLLAWEISQKGLLATSSNYLELWYGELRTGFRGIFTGQELLGRGAVLAGTSSAESEGDSLLRVIEQAANRSGDYRVLAECLRG